METSIRFIRVDGRSVKPALCFRGRNQAHAVINDEQTIRVVSNIPLSLLEASAKVPPPVMGPIGEGERSYPIELFCSRFEEIGKRKGMTLRARYLLERAKNGGVPDDATLPPDELPGGEIPKVLPQRAAGEAPGKARSPRAPVPAAVPSRPKPVSPAPRSSGAPAAAPGRTSGSDVIRRISAELKLEPMKLRKLLRSKGLSAPYTDEKLIRSKL